MPHPQVDLPSMPAAVTTIAIEAEAKNGGSIATQLHSRAAHNIGFIHSPLIIIVHRTTTDAQEEQRDAVQPTDTHTNCRLFPKVLAIMD